MVVDLIPTLLFLALFIITPGIHYESIRMADDASTVALGCGYPSDIIELQNGSLLAVWSNGMDDYVTSADIMGALSQDGKNWSEWFIIVPSSGFKMTEPQLITTNKSTFLFYTAVNDSGYFGTGLEPSVMYVKKFGTVTNPCEWSPATEIHNSSGYFSISSNPIHIKSGRWILPVYAMSSGNITHFYSTLLYSDDFDKEGLNATWKTGEKIDYPDASMNEPTMVEVRDGELLALMRYDAIGGRQWESSSFDNGITWTQPRPSDIVSPNARSHLLKLQDGKIAILWNNYLVDRSILSYGYIEKGGNNARIVSSETLKHNFLGHCFHNPGFSQRKNGDVVIIYSTTDIHHSYWYLGPFQYVYQYNAGMQVITIPET